MSNSPEVLFGMQRAFLDAISSCDMDEITRIRRDWIDNLPLLINCHGHDGLTPLMHACRNKRSETVVSFLLESGCSVNKTDNSGETALAHAALCLGNEASITLLLDSGIDANISNRKGLTPLMCAVEWGHRACAALLITVGADLDLLDSRNRSALMKACEFGEKQVALTLMEAGATVFLTNNFGLNAVEVSELHKHHSIAELLQKALFEEQERMRLELEHNADTDVVSSRGCCIIS